MGNEDVYYSVICNNKYCKKVKCLIISERFYKLWCINVKGYYGVIKMIIMKIVVIRNIFMIGGKRRM